LRPRPQAQVHPLTQPLKSKKRWGSVRQTKMDITAMEFSCAVIVGQLAMEGSLPYAHVQ